MNGGPDELLERRRNHIANEVLLLPGFWAGISACRGHGFVGGELVIQAPPADRLKWYCLQCDDTHCSYHRLFSWPDSLPRS
jgi:hypothetical protein